jgi:hypothetical protein
MWQAFNELRKAVLASDFPSASREPSECLLGRTRMHGQFFGDLDDGRSIVLHTYRGKQHAIADG